MALFQTLLESPYFLRIKEEVIGQQFDFEYDLYKVHIAFPRLGERIGKTGSYKLIQPVGFEYFGIMHNDDRAWGQANPGDQSGLDCIVWFLHIKFTTPCRDEKDAEFHTDMFRRWFKRWFAKLIRFLEVTSEGILFHYQYHPRELTFHEMRVTFEDREQLVPGYHRLTPNKLYQFDTYASYLQIYQAIQAARIHIEIRAEFRFLSEGKRAFAAGDTRKAVMDAATAVEVALTARIEQEMKKHNLPDFIMKKLFKMHSGLDSLLQLADLFKIEKVKVNNQVRDKNNNPVWVRKGEPKLEETTFNRQFLREKVGDLRNEAIHRGLPPEPSRAFEALIIASTFVYITVKSGLEN